MPNTITAWNPFPTFGKASAPDTNEDFSNLRGTRLPINPDTSTASDNTHDLGQSDHRWRNLYLGNPYQIRSTYLEGFEIDSAIAYGGSITVYGGTNQLPGMIGGLLNPYDSGNNIGVQLDFCFPVPPAMTGKIPVLSIYGVHNTGAPASISLTAEAVLLQNSITSLSSLSAQTTTATLTSVTNSLMMIKLLTLTSANGILGGITILAGNIIGCRLKSAANVDFYIASLFINFE